MNKIITAAMAISYVMALSFGCKKNDKPEPEEATGTTPYVLQIPPGLPPMQIPADNPMTVEGVALGKMLFFDPILSGDNTMSCASCHRQAFAFSDTSMQFSIGIDHKPGKRNGMPLVNLGYQKQFFWDGDKK